MKRFQKRLLLFAFAVLASRYENTAEHSWQIALFALSLAQTLELPIGVNRAVAMLLLHDVGEIDAGDKFVFAQDDWEERKAAELRAVERICGIAPEKTAKFMLMLWMEFDAVETAEARFAKAIDRSMRVLLNVSNGGGGAYSERDWFAWQQDQFRTFGQRKSNVRFVPLSATLTHLRPD